MMPRSTERVLVDPIARDARERFDRMMTVLDQMDDAEYIAFGHEAGFLNPDGSPTLPEGDPCVTLLE